MSRRARIDINRFFDEFFAGILDGRIESKITRKVNKYFLSLINSLFDFLKFQDIRELLTSVRRVFLTQPMFLRLDTPVVVCGDLHGQFNDVVRIFDAEGFPHMRNYLFLGDYIDRGQQSVELILFMFACKARNLILFSYKIKSDIFIDFRSGIQRTSSCFAAIMRHRPSTKPTASTIV